MAPQNDSDLQRWGQLATVADDNRGNHRLAARMLGLNRFIPRTRRDDLEAISREMASRGLYHFLRAFSKGIAG